MASSTELLNELVLGCEEVAKLLKCNRDSILNLHRCHRLRGYRIGKSLKWRSQDVVKFVNELDKNDDPD